MGQGKPLTSEEKKLIVALKEYFDRTKDDFKEQECPSAQKVANALGFGIATIKRIMSDYNRGISFEVAEQAFRGRPQRVLHDSTQTIVRDYIRNANKEGVYITREM
jgi:transposase